VNFRQQYFVALPAAPLLQCLRYNGHHRLSLTPQNIMQRITHLAVCIFLLFIGCLQAADVPFIEIKGGNVRVFSVAFSPDGKTVVTGDTDGTTRIWDATSGKVLKTLRGHTHFVVSAVFSSDGKRVVTSSQDGTARIWNAETGKELKKLQGHGDGKIVGRAVVSAAFSPDGKKIVTGGFDGTVRIWDAESGEELKRLDNVPHDVPHTVHSAYSVTFSLDGKTVLSSGSDKIARIWDAESGKELIKLEGHTGWVHSAAFSPDGKKVATGSYDKTAVDGKNWTVE